MSAVTLVYFIKELSTITCERCGVEDQWYLNCYDAADNLYKAGWSVINNKPHCPKCTNLINPSIKNHEC
jgi:hypothetical protein